MTEIPPKSRTSPQANVAEFSVSELANAIKRALEEGFGYVRLRGEVSGFRGPHSSGHCYFALKDDKSKVEAVIWKGVYGKLRIRPEEGMEVIATGKISSFPGSSKYQIVIEALEPAGIGALMVQLEERKKRLAGEGLFAPERKRPIPFLPRVVGVVTSPTGAVIRDMLAGFTERFPTRVIIWPARVQGEGSSAEVAAAIRGFNAIAAGGPIPRPDILIVARGGGSLEDLWGFNDEAVVRAVAESTLPIISAVGHETDWTLIDLAADARAPTPTKAAEWAVPKYSDLVAQTGDLGRRLTIASRRQTETARQSFDANSGRLDLALRSFVQKRHTQFVSASGRLPTLRSLIGPPRQRFDATGRRLGRALLTNTHSHTTQHARITARLHPRLLEMRLSRTRDRLDTLGRRGMEGLVRSAGGRRARLERLAGRISIEPLRQRLARVADRIGELDARAVQAMVNCNQSRRSALQSASQILASLSYHSVLSRGFAVVRDADGAMIRSAASLAAGQNVEIEFSDGRIEAQTKGAPSLNSGTEATPARASAATAKTRSSAGPTIRGPARGQGSLF
ncbi:MAG: exodeoxyribonuclease VII large subunit [Hyphomicrobium sp.]